MDNTNINLDENDIRKIYIYIVEKLMSENEKTKKIYVDLLLTSQLTRSLYFYEFLIDNPEMTYYIRNLKFDTELFMEVLNMYENVPCLK